MLKEKIIGKSVWVLEEKNNTYTINKDKTFTVVADREWFYNKYRDF
jgi:hypothetical protein